MVFLMFLSAHDRGLLLGFLDETFQYHSWCIFLGVLCGLKKTTKQRVSFWSLFGASKVRGINKDKKLRKAIFAPKQVTVLSLRTPWRDKHPKYSFPGSHYFLRTSNFTESASVIDKHLQIF